MMKLWQRGLFLIGLDVFVVGMWWVQAQFYIYVGKEIMK